MVVDKTTKPEERDQETKAAEQDLEAQGQGTEAKEAEQDQADKDGSGKSRVKERLAQPQKLLEQARKDMGKVALFVSLLAVALVVVFFFGMHQNLVGLEEEFGHSLEQQEQVVSGLGQETKDLKGELSKLRNELSATSEKTNSLDDSMASLDQSFKGVKSEVSKVSQGFKKIDKEMSEVGRTVSKMDSRLAKLEDLPEKTRKMLLINALKEMDQKAAYLGQQLDEEGAVKLQKAQELMQQIQSGLK
jgi:uncharacterized protein YoxC